MRANFKILMFSVAATLVATGLSACDNKVNFSNAAKEGGLSTPIIVSPTDPDPVIPLPPIVEPTQPEEPVIPPPPEEPNLNLKAGACPIGSQKVLSCLDCASKDPVLPPPLLSKKAQELLDIMTAGCSVPNKSDEPGYKAPNYNQILKRLIQCSPTGYPDTKFESTQAYTVEALLNSKAAQKAAFGGLYYNSASRDFETYFGMNIQEARNTLCRREVAFGSNGVYPIEYYDALYSGKPYTLPPIYVRAQGIRNKLRNCMAKSLSDPNPIQAPVVPGETCTYETAEGVMGQKIVEKFYEWQKQGHTVYFEGFEQCGVMERPETYLDHNTKPVKLAIKKCEQN